MPKPKVKSEVEIIEELRARITYRTNQTQLAKQLGISRSYLSELLSGAKVGKNRLGPDVLEKLGYDPTPHYCAKEPKP